MYASMAGMKHPYPGMDGMDGCKLLYSMPDRTPVTCPVEKGKSYMLVLIIPFKPTFPKVSISHESHEFINKYVTLSVV